MFGHSLITLILGTGLCLSGIAVWYFNAKCKQGTRDWWSGVMSGNVSILYGLYVLSNWLSLTQTTQNGLTVAVVVSTIINLFMLYLNRRDRKAQARKSVAPPPVPERIGNR